MQQKAPQYAVRVFFLDGSALGKLSRRRIYIHACHTRIGGSRTQDRLQTCILAVLKYVKTEANIDKDKYLLPDDDARIVSNIQAEASKAPWVPRPSKVRTFIASCSSGLNTPPIISNKSWTTRVAWAPIDIQALGTSHRAMLFNL